MAEDTTPLHRPDGLEENVSVRQSSSKEEERKKERKTAGGDEGPNR